MSDQWTPRDGECPEVTALEGQLKLPGGLHYGAYMERLAAAGLEIDYDTGDLVPSGEKATTPTGKRRHQTNPHRHHRPNGSVAPACSSHDCGKPASTKGLCHRCYYREYRKLRLTIQRQGA